MGPRNPIYVVSKGRADRPMTIRALEVVLNVTFDRGNQATDGLQAFCRECDSKRKTEDPAYAYSRLLYVLRKTEPGEVSRWTFQEYCQINGLVTPDGKLGWCSYCGNSLREWGKGFNLDRIDSAVGHRPSNCIACCSGCNWAKGSMSPDSWKFYLSGILERYERGKVPWGAIDPKGPKPVEHPNLSGYVRDFQTRLF